MSTWVAGSMAFAQGAFLFAVFLGMFRVRRFFGFGPLFLTIGAVEGLKYFLTTGFDVALFGSEVALGSVVYYPATLTIVLVVYIRENAPAARQLLWSLALANLGLGVLMTLVWMGHRNAGDDLLNQQILGGLLRVFVGTTLTFVGGVVSLIIYSRISTLSWPRLFRIWLTLASVAVADTIVYMTIVAPIDAHSSGEVLATLAGKLAFIAVYAMMTETYLRLFEAAEPGQNERQPSANILALLTYRERFQELERQVIRDPLTGTFNRRHLDIALPEHLDSHCRRGEPCALLMVDIDHFKTVNDTFGHSNGDQALVHFVRVLTSVLGRGDLLFRYGGEEFLILLPHADAQDSQTIADHIHHALASMPLLLKGESITMSCTVGIAVMPRDGTTAGELFSAADRRLYRGKQRGRHCTIAEDQGRSGRT